MVSTPAGSKSASCRGTNIFTLNAQAMVSAQ
jgi:hypothetical protein